MPDVKAVFGDNTPIPGSVGAPVFIIRYDTRIAVTLAIKDFDIAKDTDDNVLPYSEQSAEIQSLLDALSTQSPCQAVLHSVTAGCPLGPVQLYDPS